MKIKTKLAILYTTITVGILATVFTIVYIITAQTIDNHYYELLFEKAFLTAQKNYEEDELTQQAYQNILDAYKELLPETQENVILADDITKATTTLQDFLSEKQIKTLFSHNRVNFNMEGLPAVAIYYEDNEGNFIVMATARNKQGEYIKGELRNILISILLISCICVFVLIRWSASVLTRPLESMVKSMQEISANKLHLRVKEHSGNDELAQTILYFNQMIERLEISFSSQKTFIAHASHELKNPLTAIMGECEVMQLKEFTQFEYKEAISRIESEVERINKLVNSLLQLAQAELDLFESDTELVNIVEEVESIITHFNRESNQERVFFDRQADSYYITTNKQLLFTALLNLIDNAYKYSAKPVVVKAHFLAAGFELSIKDQGIGIPAEEKDKIFKTFYRASNTYAYKGSGIGLSLAYKILKLSNAKLSITSTEKVGTTVSLAWTKKF